MSRKNKPFQHVGGLKPRRNVFDLSYRKNFTCDLGELIPVLCDEVVPGDYWKVANQLTIRFQPLVAPVMHEYAATVHYFFVPNRIMWEHWEDFITQSPTNEEGKSSPSELPIKLPRVRPPFGREALMVVDGKPTGLFTLWDYFGLPVQSAAKGVVNTDGHVSPENNWVVPNECLPVAFPWIAYHKVWNEYYRDQNLQSEVPEEGSYIPIGNPNSTNGLNRVLRRNWRKDYFTSALPFQQKGIAPALPVNIDMDFSGDNLARFTWTGIGSGFAHNQPIIAGVGTGQHGDTGLLVRQQNISNATFGGIADLQPLAPSSQNMYETGLYNITTSPPSSMSATTFNIGDFRLAFAVQKWLERNARGGTRYTEFLQSHFGVSPSDSRLQRPEYLGGTKIPVIVSEVVQNSDVGSSGSPQGNLAGHGLSQDTQFAFKYRFEEYGIVLGLLSVMPKPAYQQGINRQWLRMLPVDYYFPEFAHLSEQGIENQEVFWQGGLSLARTASGSVYHDRGIFGYQGQYDEMRVKNDMVCSEMRVVQSALSDVDTYIGLSYWNHANTFAFNGAPMLTSEFITCDPDKRIYAVSDVRGLIVNCQNIIEAHRPLPILAQPSLT